jgi:hypothetical protein
VVWEVDLHILDWVCRRWGYMMPAPMCSRANSRTGHLYWIAAFTMTRQGSALAQITQSAGTVPSFSSSSYKTVFFICATWISHLWRYVCNDFVDDCIPSFSTLP